MISPVMERWQDYLSTKLQEQRGVSEKEARQIVLAWLQSLTLAYRL
jgi:hypothetical protein